MNFPLHLLRIPLNLILAALLGYTAVASALRLWWVLPPMPNNFNATPQHLESNTHNARLSVEVRPVIDAYLFGHPLPTQRQVRAQPVIVPQQAPKTALNFKLRGILYSTDGGGTRLAVIQKENGVTEVFPEGEEIIPDVILYSLQVNQALLLRNNRYETLTLEGSDWKSEDKLVRHTTASPLSGATGGKLAEYRREILRDPQKMGQYVRLSPVQRQGKLVGYVLKPGRHPGLLKDFGLENGDIVTAVNGTRLDSPMKGLTILQELAEAQEFRLEVERRGTPLNFSFTLPAQ